MFLTLFFYNSIITTTGVRKFRERKLTNVIEFALDNIYGGEEMLMIKELTKLLHFRKCVFSVFLKLSQHWEWEKENKKEKLRWKKTKFRFSPSNLTVKRNLFSRDCIYLVKTRYYIIFMHNLRHKCKCVLSKYYLHMVLYYNDKEEDD
jgi:hypothetical protein